MVIEFDMTVKSNSDIAIRPKKLESGLTIRFNCFRSGMITRLKILKIFYIFLIFFYMLKNYY